MPKPLTIAVAAGDLTRMVPGSATECPVARAIRRAVGHRFDVKCGRIYWAIFLEGRKVASGRLPLETRKFIVACDKGRAGKLPEPFDIPLPDDFPQGRAA